MKELKIGEKIYNIREILYKDLVELGQDAKESPKKLMMLSTGMTAEEFEVLSLGDGIKIQQVINDLNGLVDFQKPQE